MAKEEFPMYVDWEYYKIFYYVAKYQNFTKAARVLGNNQPNITHPRGSCSTLVLPRRQCRSRTRRKS